MASQTLRPCIYTVHDVSPFLQKGLTKSLATGRQRALSFDVVIPHLWHYRTHWKMTKHGRFPAVTSVLSRKTTQLGAASTGPLCSRQCPSRCILTSLHWSDYCWFGAFREDQIVAKVETAKRQWWELAHNKLSDCCQYHIHANQQLQQVVNWVILRDKRPRAV